MKRSLLFLLISISQISFGQEPQSFKYQAVVRDATGWLAINKNISIRTSILIGSSSGSSVYTETQILTTNENGVVSFNIGEGTIVSGDFSTINWGANTYFIQTELDMNGTSTYVFMGTSQILSFPYALYTKRTGNTLTDHDTIATNEIQNLSVSGNNLSISGGNTIVLPPDADSNPSNERQSISLIGDSLHITNGNSVYLNGAVDFDASPTNEIQYLTLNSDSLNISGSNTFVFPPFDSPTNELQNLILQNDTLSITSGNNIVFSHDYDLDSTNEIQSISLNIDTISLSNSNSILIPQTSINGTINQVYESNVSGDYILSTPQNINTTSSPSFSALNLTSVPLSLNSGGLNASLIPNSGGIAYSNASDLQISVPGSAGKYLKSGGSGSPSWVAPPVVPGNMNSVSTGTSYALVPFSKGSATSIFISPIFIPAAIEVNLMSIRISTALGAAGDIGVYDSSLNLVLNGGIGSLGPTVGLRFVAPIQVASARILSPGQYYVAITWNSSAGAIMGESLGVSGQIRRSGFVNSGGGSVLPSFLGPITDINGLIFFSLSNF